MTTKKEKEKLPSKEVNQMTDERKGLEELVQECLSSEGYVIFAGCLTKDLTNSGNGDDPAKVDAMVVNWKYRRFHFPIEDIFRKDTGGLAQFEKSVNDDLHGGNE